MDPCNLSPLSQQRTDVAAAGCADGPGQAAGAVEDRGHLEPALRQAMAKGMDQMLGCRMIASRAIKYCAEVPSEMKASPSAMAPTPMAPAAASPAPAATTMPFGKPRPTRARRAADRTARCPRAVRQLTARNAASRENGIGPVACATVEKQASGGIAHVSGKRPGHLEPYIVLGQEQMRRLAQDLGLVLPQPDQFRRGKARHGNDARDRSDPWPDRH